jgi:hypothetical protein
VPLPLAQPTGLGSLGAADLLLQVGEETVEALHRFFLEDERQRPVRCADHAADAMQHRHSLVFARRLVV